MKYIQKVLITVGGGDSYIATFVSDEKPITLVDVTDYLVATRRFDTDNDTVVFVEEDKLAIKL